MKILTVVMALLAMVSAGMAQKYAGAAPSGDDKKLSVKYQADYKAAKAAYTKSPKNAAAKKKYVAATVQLGTFCMNTPILDRKVKYAKALHYYREALKLDPSNPEAKQNSEMIISIYKSMGRPVPKDGG